MTPRLIDEIGELWLLHDSELVSRLAAVDHVAERAVTELGFVMLRPVRGGVLTMLQPPLVRPATMVATFYELVESRPERVLLSIGTGGECEIFVRLIAAMRRIEELITGKPQAASALGLVLFQGIC